MPRLYMWLPTQLHDRRIAYDHKVSTKENIYLQEVHVAQYCVQYRTHRSILIGASSRQNS